MTTKYAANCRNRNMTQEDVCFVDSLQLLTPIIVSTHSPPISHKKQKKSSEERKIKMNKIMSQGNSRNVSLWQSQLLRLSRFNCSSFCQMKVPPVPPVFIIMSVSPICPNNVTITCLCCDGFSEVYFLCLLPILSSSCGHSPRVIDDQPHLALAHIRDEQLIALLWRKKIFKAEYYLLV